MTQTFWKLPPTFWYENRKGERFVPPNGETPPPEGFEYLHTRIPLGVHHSVCTSTMQLMDGTNVADDELVTKMVREEGYSARDAVLLASVACEGCMNVMAHEFGLTWGYEKGSEEHLKCNTSCELCRPNE